jgi:uncharacterized protein with GYD domain
MARYITLIKFTDQGIRNIQETGQRAAHFKSTAKKLGVKIKETYWTLGSIDGVLVFDAKDDESATTAMLALGSVGNVHTETVRAFDAEEMSKILSKVPA